MTVAYRAAVSEITQQEGDPKEPEEDYVRWAIEEDEEDSDITYLAEEDARELETYWENIDFIYGRSFKKDKANSLRKMEGQVQGGNSVEFDGVRFDTCANRASVMGFEKYDAYYREFDVRTAIRPAQNRNLKGIIGR